MEKKAHLELVVRELEVEELLQAWHGSSRDPDAQNAIEKRLADRGVTVRNDIVEPVGRPSESNGNKRGPNPQSQRHTAPSRGSLNYRSGLKRAIAVELTKNQKANDLEICRALDDTGAVELPDRLKSNRHERSFETAYKDKRQRHRLELTISKVRTDMRGKGLL